VPVRSRLGLVRLQPKARQGRPGGRHPCGDGVASVRARRQSPLTADAPLHTTLECGLFRYSTVAWKDASGDVPAMSAGAAQLSVGHTSVPKSTRRNHPLCGEPACHSALWGVEGRRAMLPNAKPICLTRPHVPCGYRSPLVRRARSCGRGSRQGRARVLHSHRAAVRASDTKLRVGGNAFQSSGPGSRQARRPRCSRGRGRSARLPPEIGSGYFAFFVKQCDDEI